MTLSKDEFEEFINTLKDVNKHIVAARISWNNHMEEAKNKAMLNFDMNKEQEVVYLQICDKIGANFLELYKVIESSEDDLNKFNERLNS